MIMHKEIIRTTVVMPTFNKASRLKITLESLKRLKLTDLVEIVIVNDGSVDDTWDLLELFKRQTQDNEYLSVNIVDSENTGRSAARNKAIESAKGKLLIFIDDDLILAPDFVDKHIQMHEQHEKAVVHGRIYSLPYLKFFKDPTKGTLLEGGYSTGLLRDRLFDLSMFEDDRLNSYLARNARLSKYEKDIDCLFQNSSENDSHVRWVGLTGGNVSVMKEELIKVGGFDINLGKEWGCEDIELGYRLYKEGLRFYYCTEAVNYHISHYRDGFLSIHNKAMDYFIEKHRDRYIYALKEYFTGRLTSLLEWKQQIEDSQLNI